jgi:cell division protein FtsB
LKSVIAISLVLLLVLQYRLWFGDGSLAEVHRLEQQVERQRAQNQALRERNRALAAEVRDLKSGLDAVEARARSELGMVGEGETFYQVVEPAERGQEPEDGGE